MKAIWIVKGAVTDPEAHGYRAKLGDTEWQFSDGPPGERSSSADYLSLEAGIRAHAPAVFHFIGEAVEERSMSPHPESPDDWWIADDGRDVICAHCGREYPADGDDAIRPGVDPCADDCPSAQGPEGNGHDLPTCRACGHPGSDDHEGCPNCAEVPA